MLRKKNKLMKAGKIEKANALSIRIGEAIKNQNTKTFDYLPNKDKGNQIMWQKVRQITGKGFRNNCTIPGADQLNSHYANISTDNQYLPPRLKLSCSPQFDWFSEQSVSNVLSQLKQTATGLDGIPSWFLKLGSEFFALPLQVLYNKTISESFVPIQWKSACITPVPKKPCPSEPSDFRPISVTPVMCRAIERLIIVKYLYPILRLDSISSTIADQYAFRPSGSTTAALIGILNDLTFILDSEPFAFIISLDLSKAFDTVRHCTLMEKYAQLPIPDNIHNWLCDYLTSRTHCTKANGILSRYHNINASIVQGSSLGPVSYIITASDLTTTHPGNKMHKYADDTYLIIPSSKKETVCTEINRIKQWAAANNLKLNIEKTRYMVVYRNKKAIGIDNKLDGITQVESLKILGITVKHNLSMSAHIDHLVQSASQCMYALKILKNFGLSLDLLHTVCFATLISRLTYASPAWIGFANSCEIDKLQAVLNKSKRWGFLKNAVNIRDLIENQDNILFRKVLNDSRHVLHLLLPPIKESQYSLRPRIHNHTLSSTSKSISRNFVHRNLFKDTY